MLSCWYFYLRDGFFYYWSKLTSADVAETTVTRITDALIITRVEARESITHRAALPFMQARTIIMCAAWNESGCDWEVAVVVCVYVCVWCRHSDVLWAISGAMNRRLKGSSHWSFVCLCFHVCTCKRHIDRCEVMSVGMLYISMHLAFCRHLHTFSANPGAQ